MAIVEKYSLLLKKINLRRLELDLISILLRAMTLVAFVKNTMVSFVLVYLSSISSLILLIKLLDTFLKFTFMPMKINSHIKATNLTAFSHFFLVQRTLFAQILLREKIQEDLH